MTMTTVSNEARAVRLARFLKDLVQLRSKTVYDVDSFDDVLWFHDLPHCRAITSQTHAASESETSDEIETGLWLEVRHVDIPRPPSPPHDLEPWLDPEEVSRPQENPPKLQPTALLSDPTNETEARDIPKYKARLADHPGVESLYRKYCDAWESWASEQLSLLHSRRVYEKLFRLHKQLEREGQSKELRLCLGLFHWGRPVEGPPIRRHALSTPVDLHLDAIRGIIRLECPSTGAKLALEEDMLSPTLAATDSIRRQIQCDIDKTGDDVWARQVVGAIAHAWGRAVEPNCSWHEDLIPVTSEHAEHASISWAPALVLRSRQQRDLLKLYEGIERQLNEEPSRIARSGWDGIPEDKDDRIVDPRSPGGTDTEGGSFEDSETFFPLAANREQRQIVDATRTRRGVLVQGPPGTGKSHTIANLMCHMLATGQRALVTAENPRALAVLRGQIPPPLQALCISVLGHGGDAFSELNRTVQDISSRRDQWSEHESREIVDELRKTLGETRLEVAAADAELRKIRCAETQSVQVAPGYTGKPESIARVLREQQATHGWFALDDQAPDDPPCSNDDAYLWLRATRDLLDPAHEELLQGSIPEPQAIPTPVVFGDLITRRNTLDGELSTRTGSSNAESLQEFAKGLASCSPTVLSELERNLTDIRRLWSRLTKGGWVERAARQVAVGSNTSWEVLATATRNDLAKVDRHTAAMKGHTVRLIKDRTPTQIAADATVVLEHLQAGGKWQGLFGRVPRPIRGREYVREVTVDNSPADEVFELEAVVEAADRRATLLSMCQRWAPYDEIQVAFDDALLMHVLDEHTSSLEAALSVGKAARSLAHDLGEKTRVQVTIDEVLGAAEPNWLQVVHAAHFVSELNEIEHQIEATSHTLAVSLTQYDAHRICRELQEAVDGRNAQAYSRSYAELERAVTARYREARREDIGRRLTPHVGALIHLVGDSTGSDSATAHPPQTDPWPDRFARFEEAWAWAVADRWLRRLGDPAYITRLENERRKAQQQCEFAMIELAAQLAWHHFFTRLGPAETSALKGWREAVRKMGKGTGRSKKLERLRQEARHYMQQCRDAIPVWIMPRHLVAEMVEPEPGRFDTVILDEASQMGVAGLFVFYLGKRIIVVGDDQQISPSDVGVSEEDVQQLIDRHIPDLPHKHLFGLKNSLYAHAKIRFGRAIMLREHFRCMPEIIQFSNDLCYAEHGTPLDPLRNFDDSRLPPLKARFVIGGRRTGGSQRALNEVEAQALVDQLVACTKEPGYAGKTFGVISLVGNAQAREIERSLYEKLDAEEIEARRLICGDAFTFQGDERDVIFLSMVAAPGDTRMNAQTAETYVQRYNVSVSRARDQLWLFHSVQPHDLKAECLRRRLIEYVYSPARMPVPADAIDSMEFDSRFERAVAERILARGYRLRTQVQVGSPSNRYRIDLVVDGLHGKLAIECDGERWHGPERYEEDMARQRDLERVKWEFVRIRGSAFYRDPDAAMLPLWEELAKRNILPKDLDSGSVTPTNGSTPPVGRPQDDASNQRVTDVAEATRDPNSGARPTHDTPAPPEGAPAITPLALATDSRLESGSDKTVSSREALAGTEPWPDPRQTGPDVLAEHLLEIVRAQGPMLVDAAFRRYIERSSVHKLGKVMRQGLDRGLRKAVRDGSIELTGDGPHSSDQIAFLPGTATVIPRPIGDRDFGEVPILELVHVMRDLWPNADSLGSDREHLYRRILIRYDQTKLTAARRHRLDEAWTQARELDGAD